MPRGSPNMQQGVSAKTAQPHPMEEQQSIKQPHDPEVEKIISILNNVIVILEYSTCNAITWSVVWRPETLKGVYSGIFGGIGGGISLQQTKPSWSTKRAYKGWKSNGLPLFYCIHLI